MTNASTALQYASYAAYKLYEGALQPWNALARLGKKLLQLFHAYAYKAPQPKAGPEQFLYLEPRDAELDPHVTDVEAFNAKAEELSEKQLAACAHKNVVYPPVDDFEEMT